MLARIQGEPAGCGALKRLDDATGELMRMWVDGAHRGLGIGTRILDALEARAAALGRTRVRLYTNGALAEAQALYRSRGYAEIDRYNDDPYAEHFFEKPLASP